MATAKAGAHIVICAKKAGEVRVLRAQEVSKNDAKSTDKVYILRAQEVNRDNAKNRIRERGVTLIALVVTILFSYDEKLKCSNSKGFLLATI